MLGSWANTSLLSEDNIIYGGNFWQWLEKDAGVKPGLIPEELLQEQMFTVFEDAQERLPFWGPWLG